MRKLLPFLTLLGVLAAAHTGAAHGAPVVDQAGLFSAREIHDAERTITEIYDHTSPHKEVVVTTVPTLPEGRSAQQEAEALFKSRHLDGVLVYIVKQPHKLEVTVGKRTEERFTTKDDVRDAILSRFRHDDYDGGLRSGVAVLQRDLVQAFPVRTASQRGARPVPDYEGAAYGGRHFGWWSIIALGLGIYFLVRLFARRSGGYTVGQPSLGNGGFGGMGYSGFGGIGGGGGGFGRGLLGGVLGALGGNWLYDRFRGPGTFGGGFGGDAYGGEPRGDVYDVPPSDNGDVGSTSDGSWDTPSDSGNDWTSNDDGGGGGGGGDW